MKFKVIYTKENDYPEEEIIEARDIKELETKINKPLHKGFTILLMEE